MKNIKSIKIQNVRGISNETFPLTLLPFMPSFLVAPNGFGKSSFATAFNSLNRNRLALHKSDLHNDDYKNEPILSIEITNDDNTITTLVADKESNDINKEFSVYVINNQIKPEANYKKINGAPIVSPTFELPDIYILENIPEKISFEYKPKALRIFLGDNRTIWEDISPFLSNRKFICKILDTGILDKLMLVSPTKKIDAFIATVKASQLSNDKILEDLTNSHLTDIAVDHFDALVREVNVADGSKSQAEQYLIAIQILKFFSQDQAKYKDVAAYYHFLNQRDRILDLFTSFKATWKGIVPKIINIKHKGKIVKKHFGLVFPSAQKISNGERDVITFIGLLLKAQASFGRKKCILIIDEVFDYLDDANLLAVQFYIMRFIKQYKKSEVEFFPIILTHLNPYYFKNYFFSKQKVYYLKKWTGSVDKRIENIIISRNNTSNATYADNISSYFVHFNPAGINLEAEITSEFAAQGLGGITLGLCQSSTFIQECMISLDNYIKGQKNYDPLSVCIAVRVTVEQKIHDILPSVALQEEFVRTKMTVNKLDFASERGGIDVPEIYYFLGTLYNEILHIRKNNDNSSPIYLKLDNLTIRRMITEI